MKNIPAFLKIADAASDHSAKASVGCLDAYQPLLGLWLIDIALGLGWLHKGPGYNPARFFCQSAFSQVTGMESLEAVYLGEDSEEMDDDEGDDLLADLDRMSASLKVPFNRPMTRSASSAVAREVERRLLAQRRLLLERGVSPDLPLFRNTESMARALMLDDVEKAILVFAAALASFPAFNEALMLRQVSVTDDGLFRVLSMVTGHDEAGIRRAMRPGSVLSGTGIVSIDRDTEPLPMKLSLLRELRGEMLDEWPSDDELGVRLLKQCSPAGLTLDDFPHLQEDTALLQAYLRGAANCGACSVNILLYGPPGTGKTAYAKSLFASLGWRVYEIDYADSDGDPITPAARLKSMAFSQRVLRQRESVALLFDELEDVLPGRNAAGHGLLELLRGRSGGVQAKAWINRMLEENSVPTVWITNNAAIDEAYLRRFDYTLQFSIPPHAVRRRILHRMLGKQFSDERVLNRLAALEDLLPAQVERASRVVSFAGLSNDAERWQGFTRVLGHSRLLLGQRKASLIPDTTVSYRVDCLCTDTDLEALANGILERGRASLCLYGPPGTGKTAFGRYLAEQLGRGLLVFRASDLMSKWVGDSERNIAGAFAQAEREGAVLLIDEVDSFLADRRGARAQWEVTLVNEMLTQMESFQGVFVASTNLMDRLDEASLRRFDLKVRFGYLTPEAARHLLVDYCRLLGVPAADSADLRALGALGTLTPGDFATVARRHQFHAVSTAGEFVAALCAETAHKKGGVQRPIGFV